MNLQDMEILIFSLMWLSAVVEAKKNLSSFKGELDHFVCNSNQIKWKFIRELKIDIEIYVYIEHQKKKKEVVSV